MTTDRKRETEGMRATLSFKQENEATDMLGNTECVMIEIIMYTVILALL